MKRILIIWILGVMAVTAQAQIRGQAMIDLYNDAEFFFRRQDYREALYYYQQLLKKDSLNANLKFKIGNCYTKIRGQETLAIPYLQYAINNITPDYDSKSVEERQAPLHALYYLGIAYRMNNEIDKALAMYEKFIDSPYFVDNYNLTIVNNEIAATKRAKTIIDKPIEVDIKPFPAHVNTSASEFNPVISENGLYFVFIRTLKFYDATYYMSFADGKWSKPENINPQIMSDGDYTPVFISNDGKLMYFTNQVEFNKDLFYTEYVNNKWAPLQPMSKKVNSRSNEIHAALSSDQKQLLIISDRFSGKGGFDIYISTRDDNGEWNKPENLGETVNSEYNEDRAYFTNNNNTIIFCSQGHFNMGGYDVFYTNLERGDWAAPQNIGYPISNTSDNLGYCPFNNGLSLVFSKTDLSTLNEDIFIGRISPSVINLSK